MQHYEYEQRVQERFSLELVSTSEIGPECVREIIKIFTAEENLRLIKLWVRENHLLDNKIDGWLGLTEEASCRHHVKVFKFYELAHTNS